MKIIEKNSSNYNRKEPLLINKSTVDYNSSGLFIINLFTNLTNKIMSNNSGLSINNFSSIINNNQLNNLEVII